VVALVAFDWITKLLLVPESVEPLHVFGEDEVRMRLLFLPVAIIGFSYTLARENWFTPVRIVFSLILAASIGNLIDASADLQVVNFIPVEIVGYQYWTNLADIYIVVAALVLIIDILFLRHLRK
jgi:lipoprotein signal peptidase